MAKAKSPKTKYNILITEADGNTFKIKTNNLEDGFNEYKPKLVKGKLVVDVNTKDKSINKVVFVYQARKLFENSLTLKIFSRNIERALQ